MKFSEFARVLSSSAVLMIGCSASNDDTVPTSASASGKADGASEAVFCPDEVALNSGSGSAKRCFDPSNGQFVATECCADLCEGASIRVQSNGERCAWTDTPGLPGATQGQFAPQLCCDLNEDLACRRAELSDGVCVDPQGGAEVDEACCESEPASCHPSMATAIGSCVFELSDSFTDSDEPLPDLLSLFDSCTQELELLAPEINARCAFEPELPFCGLDFEIVMTDFVDPCIGQERPTYDCTFGQSFFSTADQSHINVVGRERVTETSAAGATEITREQIIAAVSLGHDDPLTLAEAFDSVDGNFVNLIEMYDLSNREGFTVVEFGAGDTSVGAFFRTGTTQMVAEIGDGDISPPGTFGTGCDVPMGPGGNLCSTNDDCATGFRCTGTIDDENASMSPLGLCIDTDVPSSFDSCSSLRDCDQGYCAGLIAFDGDGMCSPPWMFAERSATETLQVPDAGSARSDVLIYGQATVPVDLMLTLDLFHDVDTQNLTVELLIPGPSDGTDDERPRITVWPTAGVSTAHPTGGRVSLPVRAFGDESINGAWTVIVTDDTADGASGGVFGWELAFSSRFD